MSYTRSPYDLCIIQRDFRIKENEDFRRFYYRSAENVYKEFMLYAIGRNIMKYHRFIHHEIEKYEGKREQKAATICEFDGGNAK